MMILLFIFKIKSLGMIFIFFFKNLMVGGFLKDFKIFKVFL